LSRKVAIVGSRDYPRLDLVGKFVLSLPQDVVVVSGGARGVDREAERIARSRGMPTPWIFPVDKVGLPPFGTPEAKREFGRRARERNAKIVFAADDVVAFYDGESDGTLNTITLARLAGKPVRVFGPDGREQFQEGNR